MPHRQRTGALRGQGALRSQGARTRGARAHAMGEGATAHMVAAGRRADRGPALCIPVAPEAGAPEGDIKKLGSQTSRPGSPYPLNPSMNYSVERSVPYCNELSDGKVNEFAAISQG